MTEGSEHKSARGVTIGLPVLAALVTMAVSAGIGYGFLGSTVSRNTTDIEALQANSSAITKIRIAQGIAATERAGLKKDLAAIARRLEKDPVTASGG